MEVGVWGRRPAMRRKRRLEYPGACYHMINPGNWRALKSGAVQPMESRLGRLVLFLFFGFSVVKFVP